MGNKIKNNMSHEKVVKVYFISIIIILFFGIALGSFHFYKLLFKTKKDVKDLDNKIELMRSIFKQKLQFSKKILVHGDYFYNNVLFDDKLNLTAILDFSNSTVIGDYRMDIACAIMYFDLDEKYIKFLWEQAVKNYGEETIPIIKYYTAYQAFFQTESCLYNKGLYKWCLNHLNSAELWKFIESNLK